MPVTVHTYLISTFLVAGSLAVFPNIAGSDESDEVGSYSTLLEKDRASTPLPGHPKNTTPAPLIQDRKALKARPVPRPAFQQQAQPPRAPSRHPPKTEKKVPSRAIIPPHIKSPSGYSRAVRAMIRSFNKAGQPVGDIKLYAKENRWGPAVKIQNCYGDNILTRFSVTQKGETGRIWFQFKNVTYRNRGRRRHRWIMVEPGTLIRGRKILLRAQASKGNAIVSLKVLGNCIENPK